MSHSERLISPDASTEEDVLERSIRPKHLADYIGQQALREQLEIFIRCGTRA